MLRLGWTWWDYVATPTEVMDRLVLTANAQADEAERAAHGRSVRR